MFSRACEYAIKIMIYIAGNKQQGQRIGLREITKAIESPEAFTAKILQQLVRAELLKSYRGPSGGFELEESEIKLIDIVVAIDGRKLLDNCVLGFAACSGENPCPVHDKFIPIRHMLSETLLSTHLLEDGLFNGAFVSKK